MAIYLTINPDRPGSTEARRLVIHFVERLNQNHFKINATQENNLQNLVTKFNEGVLPIAGFDKSLGYAMDDIVKANNGK